MRIDAVDLTTNARPSERPISEFEGISAVRATEDGVVAYRGDGDDPLHFDYSEWIVWVKPDDAASDGVS